MRVIYIVDEIRLRIKAGLSPNEQRYYSKWTILPGQFHLTVGKEYTVYGIQFTSDGYINFILIDDSGSTFPKFYPSEFFEISDNRISKYWIGCSEDRFPLKQTMVPCIISFENFVNEKYFYNDLIEVENEAPIIFQSYKEKMDNEFPHPSLKTAIVIEGKWISCAYCTEAWENKSPDGIIVCPKNFEKNNNPFWTEADTSSTDGIS